MFLKFFCKCNGPSLTNITSYTNSGQKWWEVHTHAQKMKKNLLMSLDRLYQVLRLAEKMSSKLKWEILMREFFLFSLIGQGES